MSTVINTTEGIRAYMLLSVKATLKLQVKGIEFRCNPKQQANQLMGTNFRTAKATLEAYEEWLKKNLPKPPSQEESPASE